MAEPRKRDKDPFRGDLAGAFRVPPSSGKIPGASIILRATASRRR
jgi:hypothetical protein